LRIGQLWREKIMRSVPASAPAAASMAGLQQAQSQPAPAPVLRHHEGRFRAAARPVAVELDHAAQLAVNERTQNAGGVGRSLSPAS
jgi:hypothetical protein